MRSIISNEWQCLVCGTTYNLHKHHIFEGTSNRKNSEKYGCWVYLCSRHHNGSNAGVHYCKPLDTKLKRKCQEVWESLFGDRAAFIKIFGRSWS